MALLWATACGGDGESGASGGVAWAQETAGGPSNGLAFPGPGPATGGARNCTPVMGCDDLTTPFFDFPSCCTPSTPCGYEISYSDELLEVYPDLPDLQAMLVAGDDPLGTCVPEETVFQVRPGTYDHRVYVDDDEANDILVAEQCESRSVILFAMPGCCMPDNRCGLSTDEIAPIFEVLLGGEPAPLTTPQCLTADELNAQLANTSLAAFARIPATTGAACDHAALATALPR